jgi:hypothetical protein
MRWVVSATSPKASCRHDADYVLACKGNQGTMPERVQKAFADYLDEHREVEKGHGRIETCRCVASDILTRWQREPDLWPGPRSIVMVESRREVGDTVTTERR